MRHLEAALDQVTENENENESEPLLVELIESLEVFIAQGDASYGDHAVTRKSSTGLVVFLYGAPIEWQAIRQRAVTTSSTEAESLAFNTYR